MWRGEQRAPTGGPGAAPARSGVVVMTTTEAREPGATAEGVQPPRSARLRARSSAAHGRGGAPHRPKVRVLSGDAAARARAAWTLTQSRAREDCSSSTAARDRGANRACRRAIPSQVCVRCRSGESARAPRTPGLSAIGAARRLLTEGDICQRDAFYSQTVFNSCATPADDGSSAEEEEDDDDDEHARRSRRSRR